ncbi:MAG: MaoC family dehydratase [Burkholderiaceae bacterium]|jgi:acyl dehydratase|nr:MaoC family dehydratase [Burkholderiaceae bacterium]
MPEPQAASPAIRYYWEDMTVGTVRELGQVTVKREEVIEFARQFDPQPFHLDDAAAAETHFGRLAASGWHTCGMVMRVLVDNFLRYSSSLGSPGLEKVKWPKPVYPGDTLTVRQQVMEARPLNSRPNVGLVRSHLQAFNQHGQQVLLIDSYALFRRRETAGKS